MGTESEFRILERLYVSPPPGSVEETSLPLTFFDIMWLPLDPVEQIFYFDFPHSTSHFLESVLPNLKSSLSLSLQHFYPIAGLVRPSPEVPGKLEVHYVDGISSVSLTVAEHMAASSGGFDKLSKSSPREVNKLVPLVPQLPRDPNAQPVLAVQVTVFPGRGVALATSGNHSVGDGSSFGHFLSSWASACRTGGSVLVSGPCPVLDRTTVLPHDQARLYSIFSNAIAHSPPSESATSPYDMVVASITLGGDDIQRLKKAVSAQKSQEHDSFIVSTAVVTYAFLWVCSAKTRKYESHRVCYFVVAADCRGAIKPRPLPQSYFGNCVGPCVVEASAGELVREGGLMEAAKALGRGIREFKLDPLKDVEKWIERFEAIMPHQPLTVAGSPKFKYYDVDFGWGKPEMVEVISTRMTGGIGLSESRDGNGGVQIGLALPKREMDEFMLHFETDLKLLPYY